MAPSREQLLRTTYAFIDLFNQVPFSPEAAHALRSTSCIQKLRPKLLNVDLSSHEGIANWNDLQWAFRAFQFALAGGREPIIDESARRSAFWIKATAETVDGPYDHDIMFTLTMTEDGKKLDEIVEFMDSAYIAPWLSKFGDDEFKKRSLAWKDEKRQSST